MGEKLFYRFFFCFHFFFLTTFFVARLFAIFLTVFFCNKISFCHLYCTLFSRRLYRKIFFTFTPPLPSWSTIRLLAIWFTLRVIAPTLVLNANITNAATINFKSVLHTILYLVINFLFINIFPFLSQHRIPHCSNAYFHIGYGFQ